VANLSKGARLVAGNLSGSGRAPTLLRHQPPAVRDRRPHGHRRHAPAPRRRVRTCAGCGCSGSFGDLEIIRLNFAAAEVGSPPDGRGTSAPIASRTYRRVGFLMGSSGW